MFKVNERGHKVFDLTNFTPAVKGDRHCLVNHGEKLALTSFGNDECLTENEYRYTDTTVAAAKTRYMQWFF